MSYSNKKFIPLSEPKFDQNEIKNLTESIKTGWVSSLGQFVTNFEEGFANFTQRKYALAVNSGTAALHLAIMALGITEHDEVLVPATTYIATANAVRYVNAKPIFVDVESETGNMDPKKITRRITKKTKAIIPVHLYGNPCRMD